MDTTNSEAARAQVTRRNPPDGEEPVQAVAVTATAMTAPSRDGGSVVRRNPPDGETAVEVTPLPA